MTATTLYQCRLTDWFAYLGPDWAADPAGIADALRDREIDEINAALAAAGLLARMHRDGTIVGPVGEADAVDAVMESISAAAAAAAEAALERIGDVPDLPEQIRAGA